VGARWLWLTSSTVGFFAALGLLVAGDVVEAAVLIAALVAVVVLAVANGVWMHGRPTLSHHVVRVVVAAAIAALAVAAI